MPATMTRSYAHAEIPPVNFTPATERRPVTRAANAELTAAEIEAFVQAAVKKYLTPRELANEQANKLYRQGKTRYFTFNEMCAILEGAIDNNLDTEERRRFARICPVDADFVKAMKDFAGKEWVLAYNGDSTPVEVKYGKGWLDQ